VDVPLVIERLRATGRLTPADNPGPNACTFQADGTRTTYAQFAATWPASNPSAIPTLAEANAAWAFIVANRLRPKTVAELITTVTALSTADVNTFLADATVRKVLVGMVLLFRPTTTVAGVNVSGQVQEFSS
jgi:hypothetical protein